MLNLHNFTRGAALNDYVARREMTPITNQQIRAAAPSVFAEGAHESRSNRYAYIPTVQVLEAMRREGFVPVKATQSSARIEGRANFTKHMLTFIHASQGVAKVGDSIAQVRLINSHDGTSAYKLYAGRFRFVCSNGLIVCDSEFDSISVHHTGNIRDRVIEGSFEVLDQARKAGERAAEWQAVQLSVPEQEIFANAALQLRFEGAEKIPTTATTVLEPRRLDDNGTDLWSTFNRVQENVIRGGQRYRGNNGRRMHTREVKGIDSNTALNRALWRLADEMKTLKATN